MPRSPTFFPALLLAAGCASGRAVLPAADDTAPEGDGAAGPLAAEDFRLLVADGIDDRINSYPWAVATFDGDGDGEAELYVGTAGNALCMQVPLMGELWSLLPDLVPPDSWQCDLSHWDPSDWTAYTLDNLAPARVYRGRWNGGNFDWDRVFEPSAFEVQGFRGAIVKDDRLYMLGMDLVDGAIVWSTADGETWEAASDPGVIPEHAGITTSVRGAAVLGDTLVVGSASSGFLYAAEDPAPGNWRLASSEGFVDSGSPTTEDGEPLNGPFWDLAVLDGELYAAPLNEQGGELWRTADPSPGAWTRLVGGGYGQDGTQGFMDLTAHDGRVWAGTVTYPPLVTDMDAVVATELLRVDREAHAELLVGEARTLDDGTEVTPLSGMGPGFDYGGNLYTWEATSYAGAYYAGTFDAAPLVLDILDELYGDELPEEVDALVAGWLGDDRDRWRGFDLYRTTDGETWRAITLDGLGDRDNYGVRALLPTPWGLLLGTANPFDGFQLWLAEG